MVFGTGEFLHGVLVYHHRMLQGKLLRSCKVLSYGLHKEYDVSGQVFRRLPNYPSLPLSMAVFSSPSAQLWSKISGLRVALFSPMLMLGPGLNSGLKITRLRPKLSARVYDALFALWQFIADTIPHQQIARTPLPIRPLEAQLVEANSVNAPETILTVRTDTNMYGPFRSPSSSVWTAHTGRKIRTE